MAEPSQTALADLLLRTQSAHHEHQVNDLGGKYNEDWPQWYAQFLIENGIADFLANPPKQAKLASFLKQSYASFEASRSPGGWENFIAGEILEHHDLNPSPITPEEEPDGDQSKESSQSES